MEESDLKVGQMVWLIFNSMKVERLKIASLNPLKCRFPDGHLEEVFADELEEA